VVQGAGDVGIHSVEAGEDLFDAGLAFGSIFWFRSGPLLGHQDAT
jgi:hypothetical protein